MSGPTHTMAAAARRLVTIVVPAYNEEHNLPELYQRLGAVIEKLSAYDFEFLLIDNCSQDGTEQAAQDLLKRDPRWRYLRFSRNFGIDASLSAGVYYARGDAVIFLFSDLQEPPEEIPTMIAKWEEGYDIVYGEVVERNDFGMMKGIGARIAYRLIQWLSDVTIPPNATDFRLLNRPVIEALRRCGERNRYIRGLVHWTGFKQCGFPYNRGPRKRGQSNAGLIFCLNYAMTAIAAFSVRPLSWASLFGVLMTSISVLAMIVYTVLKILAMYGMSPLTTPPPGWTTLIFMQFFWGGLLCFFLGIIGHYIAHIYAEVKERPLWVLQRTAGFGAGDDPLGNTPGGPLP